MTSKTVFWGAVLAGTGVALGAFGSHVLKERLEPEQIATFQTGVQYHMIHALALIATGIFYRIKPGKRLVNAAFAFYLGIGLFSGSLYLMTFSYFTHIDLRWLGAITPIGGISFLVGWGQLAWGAESQVKKK
jgi:uncharacterized membrane protein YgdD (TMEM256/DUF423 family)